MTACDRTIYQTCREAAGLTQEQAAEQLNCSVRTLARYEAGEQRTPDDVAYQMAVVYDSHLLAFQHLRLVSQVAENLLPPVMERELGEAAMRIFNRVRRFAEQHQGYRLLEIAEDNVISPEEEPLYYEIVQELLEIDQAILELRVVRQGESLGIKSDRSAAGTTERSGQRIPRFAHPSDNYILPQNPKKHKPRNAREGVTFP